MFSCLWRFIYWYWWCASGASAGWLVPNGHHHWAGRPRPCARTYNLEKSLSLSKHKHDNSKNSCRWVKRCDALRLDKCFCHRTTSESDEADQSEDQRKVVTLTKYAELVFPGKVCKVCCGTRQKIYYKDKNILDISRIKNCHGKPPKNRGIDLSKKEDDYMPKYIYHALFRHERAKGSI